MSVISILTTGINAMDAVIKTCANNISNAETPGFKITELVTNNLPYHTLFQSGASNGINTETRSNIIQIGTGTKIDGTYMVPTLGNANNTSVPTDVMIAIESAYFAFNDSRRKIYSRNGHFTINGATRALVGPNSMPLYDDIIIPEGVTAQNIFIDTNGAVRVTDPNGNSNVIGQITLWKPLNEQGLKALGNGLFSETDISGQFIQADTRDAFQSGCLESSNVDIVSNLMTLQKSSALYATLISITAEYFRTQRTMVDALVT